MKKFISNIMAGLVLVSAPALVSCGADYLNTAPTESVSADDAVATTENAYKALNGIAKTMSTQQAAWDQGCAGENRIIALPTRHSMVLLSQCQPSSMPGVRVAQVRTA